MHWLKKPPILWDTDVCKSFISQCLRSNHPTNRARTHSDNSTFAVSRSLDSRRVSKISAPTTGGSSHYKKSKNSTIVNELARLLLTRPNEQSSHLPEWFSTALENTRKNYHRINVSNQVCPYCG